MNIFQRIFPALHRSEPRLRAIFIAAAAGLPMQNIDSIRAVAGRGLEGDRYHDGTGHWKATDGCQVTLMTGYELQQARTRTRIDLDSGAHRRNLVLDGIRLKDLEGRRFRIGEAVFEYQKRRPPCGYIERIAGKGMVHALGKGSGACITVIESGIVRVGDTVTVLTDRSRCSPR